MKRSAAFLLVLAGYSVCPSAGGATIHATFAGFAADETRVADFAIGYWERAILDPLVVDVAFRMSDLTGDQLGASSNFVEATDGVPAAASIEIDDRAGSVIPWFVDLTPERSEEYGPGANPWDLRGKRPGAAGENYDLLTVLYHELAHALGFSVSYRRFLDHVGPSDLGDLRSYTGTAVAALLTPEYEGTHLSDAVHPADLMNAFQSRGERLVPSDLDFALLSDAFGYSIERPAGETVPEPKTFGLTGAACLLLLAWWRARRRPERTRRPT